MKKIIILLIFLSGVFPGLVSAEEYTLDDLYRLALERSETVKIAEENAYISERDKDRALAVLLPTLSAFGSYTKYSEERQASSFTVQPGSSSSWGLRLNQSVSMSGRELTAFGIAKETIVKTRFDLDNVKEQYLLNVASSYYDVLKAGRALEIAGSNVDRLTKHRDAAQTRLKVGEATKTALLRAEAELAGAQSDMIKAENDLKLMKAILARTVGLEGDYDIRENPETAGAWQSQGTDTGLKPEKLAILTGDCRQATVDCLKQTALSERRELKASEYERNIAKEQIKFAEGLYWPDLSVEGVYSRTENDPSVTFEIKENIYGVLKIDFPFFEGGLRRAEVRQAEARFRQADYKLADLKKSVNIEVENAYLNLITVSGVLEKLQAEAAFASDNYNAVSKQFQFGLADSIDVMDANTLLVTSERQLANAGYDYQFAVLQLERATGTLLKTVSGKQ